MTFFDARMFLIVSIWSTVFLYMVSKSAYGLVSYMNEMQKQKVCLYSLIRTYCIELNFMMTGMVNLIQKGCIKAGLAKLILFAQPKTYPAPTPSVAGGSGLCIYTVQRCMHICTRPKIEAPWQYNFRQL